MHRERGRHEQNRCSGAEDQRGLDAKGSSEDSVAVMNDDPLRRVSEPDVFPGIYLGNAERCAAQYPMCRLPSLDVRCRMRPGDYAKLMFEAHVATGGCSAEYMWVLITGRAEGPPRCYTGTVDNKAAHLAIPLGGLVMFRPEHVLDVRLVQ